MRARILSGDMGGEGWRLFFADEEACRVKQRVEVRSADEDMVLAGFRRPSRVGRSCTNISKSEGRLGAEQGPLKFRSYYSVSRLQMIAGGNTQWKNTSENRNSLS